MESFEDMQVCVYVCERTHVCRDIQLIKHEIMRIYEKQVPWNIINSELASGLC